MVIVPGKGTDAMGNPKTRILQLNYKNSFSPKDF
jgi:hypothetical protein